MKLWLCICFVVGAATWVGGAHGAVLEGTSGPDVIEASDVADHVYGWGGSDTINGNRGDDLLIGGSGLDRIDCGRGHDNVQSNGGDDLIVCTEADARKDKITCGAGQDIAFWRVKGTFIDPTCEQVFHVTRRQP